MSTSQMFDFVIVGAGLFGSVFAREVAEQGKTCLILEKRDALGGNCHTKRIEGVDVHVYGPHIFHTNDDEIWSWINRFSTFIPYQYSPVANYQGEMYSLPFNMWTFNQIWGVRTEAEAREMIRQQTFTGTPTNLEEQALSMVGKDVYEKLIKGYTQKQWGTDPRNLPTSIIRRIPVRFTWNSNYFDDKYQGIPASGYTAIFERMLDHENIEVRTGVDFLADKSTFRGLGRTMVYTGPIDRYFDYRFGDLNYRSLRWETTTLDTANFQGCAVMNHTDVETPYVRTIEHKWFNPQNQTKTVVSREFPVAYRRGGEPFYPCLDAESQARHQLYRSLAASEPDSIFGGRLAEYKYYDMHQVIASARIKAANAISS